MTSELFCLLFGKQVGSCGPSHPYQTECTSDFNSGSSASFHHCTHRNELVADAKSFRTSYSFADCLHLSFDEWMIRHKGTEGRRLRRGMPPSYYIEEKRSELSSRAFKNHVACASNSTL